MFTAPDKAQILAPECNPCVFGGHALSYRAAAAFQLQEFPATSILFRGKIMIPNPEMLQGCWEGAIAVGSNAGAVTRRNPKACFEV